jgi:hypothetical protein
MSDDATFVQEQGVDDDFAATWDKSKKYLTKAVAPGPQDRTLAIVAAALPILALFALMLTYVLLMPY